MDPVISILLTAFASATANVTPGEDFIQKLLLGDSDKYSIIITSEGNGIASASSDSSVYGVTINLIATANPGNRFVRWEIIAGKISISNLNSSTASFKMPSGNVELKAIFEEIPTYQVTVINGTGSFRYEVGARVNIEADTAPIGKRFKEWTSDNPNVIFNSPTNTSTRFTMPESDVIITAIYEYIEYSVTIVSSGTGASGSGNYNMGNIVEIHAGTVDGYDFSHWNIIPNVTFISGTDATSSVTKFTMPADNVIATAVYENFTPIEHTITILYDDNGTASSNLQSTIEGTLVTLNASPNYGYIFTRWEVVSGNIIFSDDTVNPIKFSMPAHNVTIKALFDIDPDDRPTEYVYPPTAVFIHEIGTLYEARPSIESGVFIIDEIILPANDSNEDQIYTFEVYTNGQPTGIMTTAIVYYANTSFLEASQIIVNPDKFSPDGGNVAVRIEFQIPEN